MRDPVRIAPMENPFFDSFDGTAGGGISVPSEKFSGDGSAGNLEVIAAT